MYHGAHILKRVLIAIQHWYSCKVLGQLEWVACPRVQEIGKSVEYIFIDQEGHYMASVNLHGHAPFRDVKQILV